MRLTPGEEIQGITCVAVVKESTNYNNVVYKVRWSCGHTGDITGSALARRIWQLSNDKGTNQCPRCAHSTGRKRAAKTRAAKAPAAKNRKTIPALDAMRLMRGVRDKATLTARINADADKAEARAEAEALARAARIVIFEGDRDENH